MAGAVSWPSVSTASFSAGHSLPADRAPRARRTSPGCGHGGAAEIQRGRDALLLQQPAGGSSPGSRPPQSTSTALPAVPVVLQVRDGGLQAAAVGGELLGIRWSGGPGAAGGSREVGRGVQHDHGEVLQRGVQLLGGEGRCGALPRHAPRRSSRASASCFSCEDSVLRPLVHPAALTEEHHRVRRQVVDAGGDSRDRSGCQIPVQAAGGGRAAAQPLRVLPQRSGTMASVSCFCAAFAARAVQLSARPGRPPGASGAAPPPPAGSGRRSRSRIRRWVPGSKSAHGVDLIVEELARAPAGPSGGRTRPGCRPAGRTGPRPPPAGSGYSPAPSSCSGQRAPGPPARPPPA